MPTHRVHLKSVPGPYEQYQGVVEVSASVGSSDDELFDLAVTKLRRTSFPDRSKEMWKFVKAEELKHR